MDGVLGKMLIVGKPPSVGMCGGGGRGGGGLRLGAEEERLAIGARLLGTGYDFSATAP